MKHLARSLTALLLAALVAGPALADDVKKEEPKKPDVKKEEPKKEEPKKDEPKKEEPKKPEPKKEEPKKPAGQKADPSAALFTFPKQIKLDDKQTASLEDLKKEYLPKLQDLDKKSAAILTPERTKARAEAIKKAKEDGKKGKELAAAGNEAMKLSADESAQLKEINASRGKLRKEVATKKNDLLTEDQKKLIQPKPKKAK